MKIENSNASFVRLYAVLSGETFIVDSAIYIKGEKSGIDDVVCIRLADGHTTRFFEGDMVLPIKAKVVIE
jgi:hypothetical protein